MEDSIQLSKSSLVKILDHVILVNESSSSSFPSDDTTTDRKGPFGPYGPGGPVLSQLIASLLESDPQPQPWRKDNFVRAVATSILEQVALNPQPLPPKTHLGRVAKFTQNIVNQAIGQFQQVELFADVERGAKIINKHVHTLVDDFCGTVPRQWPWPWPVPTPGPDPDPWPIYYVWQPIDLLIAGAQFQKAADNVTEEALKSIFGEAANKLFETGLNQF